MTEGSNIVDSLKHYVKIGSLQDVQRIINMGDLKFEEDYRDYYLLRLSIFYKHSREITKLFVEHNFRVNKSSSLERYPTPLHMAVQRGWKDVVECLLQKGASVTVVASKFPTKTRNTAQISENLLTPIQLSFLKKRYKITDMLLVHDEGKAIFNSEKCISHLHIAAARNCGTAINKYLKFGADINLCTPEDHEYWPKYTPLHFAVQFQKRETTKLLLKCGADITAQNTRGNTPLHLAAMLQNDSLIDLILSEHKYSCENPKNEDGLSHFHIACARYDSKNVNFVTDVSYKNISLLHVACMEKNEYEIKRLIDLGVSVNERLPEDAPWWPGATALHILSSQVNGTKDNIINLILDSGADIAAVDARGKTPLHITFEKNYLGLCIYDVDLMLAQYSKVNVDLIADKDGLSHFHIACTSYKWDFVDKFLDAGADINSVVSNDSLNYPGYTPLHMAVAYEQSTTTAKLLKRGADITIKNGRGLTAYDLVVKECYINTECIELFLKAADKINSDVFDTHGFTLLQTSCVTKNENLFKSSIDRLTINTAIDLKSHSTPGYTALHFAVLCGTDVMVRTLLDYGADPSISTADGQTPLHLWCIPFRRYVFNKDETDVKIRLNAFDGRLILDENPFDSGGLSQFHVACELGELDVVRSFLDRGVDVNLKTKPCGETGLHMAVFRNEEDFTRLLLESGADVNARDTYLQTPLDKEIDSYGRKCYGIEMRHNCPFGKCRRGASIAVLAALLEYGADIRIPTMNWTISYQPRVDSYRCCVYQRQMIRRLFKHIVAMITAGCQISYVDRLQTWYLEMQHDFVNLWELPSDMCCSKPRYNSEVEYQTACRAELEGMEFNLRAALRQNIHKLVGNGTFFRVVDTKGVCRLALKYPIYGFLLVAQYRRGMKRRELMKKGMWTLKRLVSFRLCNDCVEAVLQYLTNEELSNLVDAANV